MDAKRINIDQLYQQKEMQLEPLPFGAWEDMSQKLHGKADDLQDKNNLSSGSTNFLFAIALIVVGTLAFYLFSKQKEQEKLVPEIAHTNNDNPIFNNQKGISNNEKNYDRNETYIASNTELAKVSGEDENVKHQHSSEKVANNNPKRTTENIEQNEDKIEKSKIESATVKNIKLENISKQEKSKVIEYEKENISKVDQNKDNPEVQQALNENGISNKINSAEVNNKEQIFDKKQENVNQKLASNSLKTNRKFFKSNSSTKRRNKEVVQQLNQTEEATRATSSESNEQAKNPITNKRKLVSRKNQSIEKSVSTKAVTEDLKNVSEGNFETKLEQSEKNVGQSKSKAFMKKSNLNSNKSLKNPIVKTFKQNQSDKNEKSEFIIPLVFLNAKFGKAICVDQMSMVDFFNNNQKRIVQQFKMDNATTSNFLAPLMQKFDLGVKAGYEMGLDKYAINKSVFAGIVYYKLSDKVSIFLQPGIKLGGNVTYPSFTNNSYYNLTGTSIDTFTIQDSMSSQLLAVVTQNSDSFVVVKTITKGSNVQLELILGAKYRIGNHFGISAGIGFNKGVLPYFTEVKNSFGNQKQIDSFQAPMGTFLVIDTTNSFFHTATNLNQYTPFNGLTQATDPLRINYFASVEYWYNRWSLELSVTQQLTKLNNLNDKNLQSSYEQPYFRIMAGWKIRK